MQPVVIDTAEPLVKLHVQPATLEGNGVLLSANRGGVVESRVYLPWGRVPELEATLRQLRDERGE